MIKYLIFFLLSPFLVFATHDPFDNLEEDPTLFNHVNVISGNLNLSMEDAVVQGVTSFPIMRTYSSSGALEKTKQKFDIFLKKLHGDSFIQGGWNLFPDLYLFMETSKKNIKEVYVAEKNGSVDVIPGICEIRWLVTDG